jgi:methyl-accepting chemotaxis protein
MRRLRITIAQRIWLGFGAIIIAMIIYALIVNSALKRNQAISQQVGETYSPSLLLLKDLFNSVNESQMLIRDWIFIDKNPESRYRSDLNMIHDKTISDIDASIKRLRDGWQPGQQKSYTDIYSLIIDSMIPMQREIIRQFPDAESYTNSVKLFEYSAKVQDGGELSKLTYKILHQLSALINTQADEIAQANSKMAGNFSRFVNMLIVMTVLLIFISVVIAVMIIQSLVRPINYIKTILGNMSKGVLPSKDIPEGKDEMGQMSKALNNLVRGLKAISDFSLQIGKGNFESDFKPLSEEDILGNALINMREEVKKAAMEDEHRKKEDDQRNWASQGLAKFAEILRQNNNSIDDLSYNIISNLVKYLEANQGGLFLINNTDYKETVIELNACYAYDRRKFLEKRISMGEGLIGRCVQEKDSIYLTEIPKDYIRITSGLGDDNPRSLLLVPLVINEDVFGVLEIASFREFEPYQIEFVEKLATSIASTISSVKINVQTKHLLEQSRQQAEEMSAQEEEMRQNMEELRSTQEQSSRREELLARQVAELKEQLAKSLPTKP